MSGWGSVRAPTVSSSPGSSTSLLRTDAVDFDYLVRYTNAHWLVIDDPGAADDGLFVRDAEGNPLAADADGGPPLDANRPGIAPRLVGEAAIADGRRARPAFELLARRFLDDGWAPEAAASRCGIAATTIRRIAAELAAAAFGQRDHARYSVDGLCRPPARARHRAPGRPCMPCAASRLIPTAFTPAASSTSCRSSSAPSMCPAAIATRRRIRGPIPPGIRPAGKPGQVKPNTPLAGPPLGFVQSPEDLSSTRTGRPAASTRPISWEAPLAAHGLMHTVIANAARRDPYAIEVLFALHGQHGLELGHERRRRRSAISPHATTPATANT